MAYAAIQAVRSDGGNEIAESVVPITHVPDDPGPDAFQEPEPVPEQNSGGSGWKRLFQ